MGENDLRNFLAHERLEIVAICDVDSGHLEKAAQLVPAARRYTDWREMFAKEGDRIDSANVTTPDHMHFPIAHEALRLGKHVYCQKPMCHDIAEVRLLTEFADQKGVEAPRSNEDEHQIFGSSSTMIDHPRPSQTV